MANYKTVHYLIALLKEYGIKHIVACPGTQNATFNLLVQENPSFECYSVVDERSASYVAIGLSNAIHQPVVVNCTGATSARNFQSAMTEAYYSNIPLVALTGYNPLTTKFNFRTQYTDRSVSPNDIKDLSVTLPEIKDDIDRIHVITAINAALSLAKYNNRPVHINFPYSYNYDATLPDNLWKTQYYYDNFEDLQEELANKRVAIFIGQHKRFTKEQEVSISSFVKAYGIPVICDHTANYNGENKVSVTKYRNFNKNLTPDIIIDIGRLSEVFGYGSLWNSKNEVWRISEHYEYKTRFDCRLTKLLLGKEEVVFRRLTPKDVGQRKNNPCFHDLILDELNKFTYPPPSDLRLSVLFIAQQLVKHIPNGSRLQLAVIQCQVSTGLFDLHDSVEVFCNLGGYGIDGPLSTAVGESLADPSRKVFCFIGDLSFFYDMNILGNRHIKNLRNLRILLENNHEGCTFRHNAVIEPAWGEKASVLVSAAGHYKNGAKGWVESCGFKYMCARTQEEYLAQIDDFCNKEYDSPVVFEVFTTVEDNKEAYNVFFRHYAMIYPNDEMRKALERVMKAKNRKKGKSKDGQNQ